MATATSDEPPPTAPPVDAGTVEPPVAGTGATVHASDETSRPAAGRDGLNTERWAGLAASVLRDEGVATGELGLHFVDPGPMAELNVAHMGAPGPTDVLAFPIDAGDGADSAPHPPGPARLLGDVVVCPVYAAAGAPDHAGAGHDGGLADELALLVVHGVLHVLGYDHACDAGAAVMRAREQQLLAAHHRAP